MHRVCVAQIPQEMLSMICALQIMSFSFNHLMQMIKACNSLIPCRPVEGSREQPVSRGIPFQSSTEDERGQHKPLRGRVTHTWVYLGQPWIKLLSWGIPPFTLKSVPFGQ